MTRADRSLLAEQCVEKVKDKRKGLKLTYNSPREWKLTEPEITEIVAPMLEGVEENDKLLIRHLIGFKCAQPESYPK